jgi:hypothetical protein
MITQMIHGIRSIEAGEIEKGEMEKVYYCRTIKIILENRERITLDLYSGNKVCLFIKKGKK